MQLDGRTVLITGAARGIGRALAVAAAAAGARVAVSDLDSDELRQVAELLGHDHVAVSCDVAIPTQIDALIERIANELGPIEVCFANAGIAIGTDVVNTPHEVWERAFAVNVGQHIELSRRLIPGWLERGEGYLVVTASAAGLLTQIGSAPYAVSKHAAVALAEWLAITYGDRGIRVSCLAPMGVATAMLDPGEPGALEPVGSQVVRNAGQVLDPADVSALTLQAIAEERFLVLPHPEVAEYFRRKASDYDRWLSGMRRVQAAVTDQDV